ncbi:hypothetical protein PtrV1_10682 [Pyrenophora tritici-repentis]|nr:hypothetical protein PtrV1_10682 [Pyrenophora tritici-repentis]KAI0569486.1 hypothetical protein Alg215_11608 [Pyrenophora tritici-repentis]PZC89247.1 hypothetical protein A1F95_10429 [Pyrenophora tritici-repentis]PZD22623.1 hypothetical protein A1F96_10977 [Pyrenophora tritici-repentis]
MALLWLAVIAGVIYIDETFPNAYGNTAVLGSSCLILAYLWYQARSKVAMGRIETWRYTLREMWEILISIALLILAILITVVTVTKTERYKTAFRYLPGI